MKKQYLILITLLYLAVSCKSEMTLDAGSFTEESSPERIGRLVAARFVREPFSQYGSPLRFNEPRTQVTYPDVCAWLGSLRFAQDMKDSALCLQLLDKFQPLLEEKAYLLPKKNHVDNNVFGSVPLELYHCFSDKRFLEMGLDYADSQWTLPEGWAVIPGVTRRNAMYGDAADADICQVEQKVWNDRGYSWQTRFWLDDMFMITTLQAHAYKVTGDRKYIDRAAREMVLYLNEIQRDNGLFDHGPGAPFAWGRGNGWMAVGMTDVLRALPDDSEFREPIYDGYLKMMDTLVENQEESGMWRQVIDDSSMWEESSGTAMFTYSMISGVKHGWLKGERYVSAARNGWLALSKLVDAEGAVSGVCEGTMLGDNSEHYRSRKCLVGDVHGQAPVLWCACALLE